MDTVPQSFWLETVRFSAGSKWELKEYGYKEVNLNSQLPLRYGSQGKGAGFLRDLRTGAVFRVGLRGDGAFWGWRAGVKNKIGIEELEEFDRLLSIL